MSWDRQINIKSQHEIEIMREAGRINAEALAAIAEAIQPGVTTGELNDLAEAVLKKYGAYSPFKNYPGPYPYPKSVCISINEELVHGIPGKRKLKSGDIVSVDCGAVYKGYVGDAAFTKGVGEISAQAQKLISVTEQALFAGIEKMKAGNYLGDVGSAVQKVAESQGFYVTREYTGHGVGRRMHEGPQVPNYGVPGKGMLIKTGMTMAIEPMLLVGTAMTRVTPDEWTVVSEDNSLTAHFEHSVAITENGPLILTALADGSNPWDIAGQR
jgi:methionyl aminopeptidase